jgi:hypothetical protein
VWSRCDDAFFGFGWIFKFGMVDLQTPYGATRAQDLVQDWTGDFVVDEPGPNTQTKSQDTTQQPKDFTDDFAVEQDPVKAEKDAECFRETDPHRVSQRQRQIDFGKNTIGYQRMSEAHPVKHRRPKTVPRTPDVHKECSKRAFDGLIRQWRRRLHEWDLPQEGSGDEIVAPRDPRLPQKNSNKRLRGDRDEDGKEGHDKNSVACKKPYHARKAPSPAKLRRTVEKSACGVELDFAAD